MDPTTITVACCADEAFVRPLAVAVRSLLEASGAEDLRLYVVDFGIRARSRHRLRASWPGLDVTFLRVPRGRLYRVPLRGSGTPAHYGRLLLPELLPTTLERVLYLDADVLVRKDVRPLWELPLDGAPCLAARDAAAPCVDPRTAPNYETAHAYLGSSTPIPNHQALGLPGHAPYFNSGVLLIDLAAWRAEDLAGRMFACLEANRPHVRLFDQYALNVVLADRWRELPARYNAQTGARRYPSWRESPYDEATYDEVLCDPAILHFAARSKPWDHGYPPEEAQGFFDVLDRTAWAGWRPRRALLGVNWRRKQRSFHRYARWFLGMGPAPARRAR